MIKHGDVVADRSGRACVQQLQPRTPSWLLMYSPRRRKISAFFLGPSDKPLIVDSDDPDPDQLLKLLDTAAITATWTPLAATTPMVPSPWRADE
ncbi:hypothetical protein ACGF0J_22390 [Nonomuraea sp. NPDC047897]|uniref:hypothetical protein n=1 Tax=Nonomuraea sp. NPDC047897 TaxID=3364346 RepID=UPI003715745B